MNKILHLITGLQPGGAQTVLSRLLQGMDKSCFDNVVVTMRKGGAYTSKITDSGVRVRSMDMDGVGDAFKGMRNLSKIIKEEKPQIISAWMYHANVAAIISRAFREKVPVVWNIRHSLHDIKHEDMSTALVIRFGSFLSKYADKIVYNSKASARQHEAFGYCNERSVFVPNGYDGAKFGPNNDCRARLIEEIGLSKDTMLFGHVGRYHRMKDHATLIKAAASLLKRHANVHFLFAGDGVDKSNEELRKLIDKYRMNSSISLMGERSDIQNLYSALDTLVLSSSYGEGFPNVVGEAMACGVPCVVTDVGDSASIVSDTGFVVPRRDSDAMADAMARMVTIGSEKRFELGGKARDRIMKHYSLDNTVKSYEIIYKDLLTRGKSLPSSNLLL